MKKLALAALAVLTLATPAAAQGVAWWIPLLAAPAAPTPPVFVPLLPPAPAPRVIPPPVTTTTFGPHGTTTLGTILPLGPTMQSETYSTFRVGRPSMTTTCTTMLVGTTIQRVCF